MGKILVILAFLMFSWTWKHKYYRIVKLLPDLVLVDNYNDEDTITISDFEEIYLRDKGLVNWCIGCTVTLINETDSTHDIKVNGSSIDGYYEFEKTKQHTEETN